MTIDSIQLAKTAVGFVVGAGVSKIVHAVIKNNITPEKVLDKISVVAASVVVGSMAREATKEYTDRQIDNVVTQYRELKAKIKGTTEEA